MITDSCGMSGMEDQNVTSVTVEGYAILQNTDSPSQVSEMMFEGTEKI